MTRGRWLIGACLCILAACSEEPQAERPARGSSQNGIINLLTLEAVDAGSTLALHHGAFRRDGRCLVLDAEGSTATPVFPADSGVSVEADGIRIAGLDFRYGDTVALPGLGRSYAGEAIGECPAARRPVRAVEAAGNAR